MSGSTLDQRQQLVLKYITESECDLFVFSAGIDEETADAFINLIPPKQKRKPNVACFLTTYGGNPHAAYRMARALRRSYTNIRLIIVGYCKSAGTLITLGADEIAFGPFGELGPIDMQVRKPDEIFAVGSGLDVLEAVSLVTDFAFGQFRKHMQAIAATNGGGAISTKLASEIAAQLTTGLFGQISAQIDPLRMAEVNRAIIIAQRYGEKLGAKNLKQNALETIVTGYPSHAFVIDLEEAQKLFENVRELTEDEAMLAALLHRVVRDQYASPMILDVWETIKPNEVASDSSDADGARSSDTGSTVSGQPETPGNTDGPGALSQSVMVATFDGIADRGSGRAADGGRGQDLVQ